MDDVTYRWSIDQSTLLKEHRHNIRLTPHARPVQQHLHQDVSEMCSYYCCAEPSSTYPLRKHNQSNAQVHQMDITNVKIVIHIKGQGLEQEVSTYALSRGTHTKHMSASSSSSAVQMRAESTGWCPRTCCSRKAKAHGRPRKKVSALRPFGRKKFISVYLIFYLFI